MKALLLAAFCATAVAPAATAATWHGPAPTVVAAQLTLSVNKILATPVCGKYACSAPSTNRFARATCIRETSNPFVYDCTAPLVKAGVVQTDGAASNVLKGTWTVQVAGTATNWRGAFVANSGCVPNYCGGIMLSPLTQG